MTNKIVKRKKMCECGNDRYHRAFNFDNLPNKVNIWKCANCLAETPRQTRKRRTNAMRALDLRAELLKEWEETDKTLQELTTNGMLPGGWLLAYGSTFNYHVSCLLSAGKITNWDLQYHAKEARNDLKVAKERLERAVEKHAKA